MHQIPENDESGQVMVEYALITSICVIAVGSLFGIKVNGSTAIEKLVSAYERIFDLYSFVLAIP